MKISTIYTKTKRNEATVHKNEMQSLGHNNEISEDESTTLSKSQCTVHPLSPTVIQTGHMLSSENSLPVPSRAAIRTVPVYGHLGGGREFDLNVTRED